MLDESDEPRQTSVTLAAYRARCNAACLAEFAPPTTNTFPPVNCLASDGDEP